jgi:hypothetical protein
MVNTLFSFDSRLPFWYKTRLLKSSSSSEVFLVEFLLKVLTNQ